MKRQQILILIGVAAVILFLVGLGIVVYALSQGATLPSLEPAATPAPAMAFDQDIPQLELTPPPSLLEIADQIRPDYPELADLLENQELGSVYKDFYLAYQQGGEPAALALAHQRGLINERDEIIMTLVLDTEDTAPLIAELEAEGIIIQESYKNLVNIAIPLTLIQTQLEAEEPELIVQRLSNLDHVIRLEFPDRATIKQGKVLGQGVDVTEADSWHERQLTGKGVKVGVLDLGFAGYEELLGKELPAQVEVARFGDDFSFDSEVHGTACAEIIYEMAPEAQLYLAYYDGSDAAFGRAVEWLISQEVDIISNSTGSNGLAPLDGTSFDAQLADKAHDAGIFWVNAAGNEADTHYRGQFNDTDKDTFHEFAPDTTALPILVPADYPVKIIMSWDDWQNVDQDYELLLLNQDGDLIAKSEEPQDGQPGQLPVEGLLYEFDEEEIYLLAVENYDGLARGDATLDIFVHGGLVHPDFAVPERSLSTPADARGAFAVGAVNWADDLLEPYSSRGPTLDGRLKPELAAPSVVDTASYAPEAFDGTSAATPHVAGAAALVLEAFPGMTPAELAAFLQERALDLGDNGPDNEFGAGRLMLGSAPEKAEAVSPAENPPPAAVELRPTSTPRPALEAPAVSLPGRPIRGGGSAGSATTSSQDSSATGFIILLGLCFLCLGGLTLPILIIAAVVLARRR